MEATSTVPIKKMFAEIVELLNANKDKSVKDILPQAIRMASAKTNRSGGTTYLKDVKGKVVAIKDYYFKRWMPLVGDKAVEFGVKKSTATGFSAMSKEGVSNWTKQNSESKKEITKLYARVKSEEVKVSDIDKFEAEIEVARNLVVKTTLGFETKEQVEKYLADQGIKLEVK